MRTTTTMQYGSFRDTPLGLTNLARGAKLAMSKLDTRADRRNGYLVTGVAAYCVWRSPALIKFCDSRSERTDLHGASAPGGSDEMLEMW